MEHGWSLDISRWRKLKSILSGYDLRWKCCNLEKIYRDNIPRQAGVYMLCCFPLDCEKWFKKGRLRIFNAMYIGKSTELHRRFGDYVAIRNLSPTIAGFLHQYRQESLQTIAFIYAPCAPDNLLKVEGALIDCFGPSANERREGIGETVQGQIKPPINL